MRSLVHRALTPVALLLLLTACGADGSTAGDGTTAAPRDGTGAAGGAASACLEGAADCEDVPTGTGGVESGPDGSLAVADAVAVGVDGPFLMSGYYVADGEQARLCEALAESFPPQCGGASAVLDESGASVEAVTTTEGEVTWSDEPVAVEGRFDGDVFVVGAP